MTDCASAGGRGGEENDLNSNGLQHWEHSGHLGLLEYLSYPRKEVVPKSVAGRRAMQHLQFQKRTLVYLKPHQRMLAC